MSPPPFARRPLIEELEPRLLFSADFAPAVADMLGPQAEQRILGGDGEYAHPQDTQQQAQHARLEVVFIDLRVQDYEKILADIHEQNADGRSIEVVLLDTERDGVAQIGDFLGQRHDIDAVHLISHGSAGTVQLGAGELNFDSLLANASAIKQWGNALSDDADILIYGCDVASTEEGRSLVQALGRLTGADVAASDDRTGAAGQDGDWVLEYRTGTIQTGLALSTAMQQNWANVLAITANGAASSTQTTNANSLTWSHTVASGTDRLLVVELAIDGLGAATTSVTYGGVAMTQIGRGTGNHAVEIWALVNPAVGTANIIATFAGTTAAAGGATGFNGVNQSTPFGTFVSATGTGTTASVTVSSATGDLVIDAQYWKVNTANINGAGQTTKWSQANASMLGGSTTEAGAASVTMSGTSASASQWEIGAISIKAATTPAGITVSPISGLVTTESGGTAMFSVVLDRAPTADVTIGLSSSNTTEGTLSTSSLTFTTANWSTPQTVTIYGVDDTLDDGDVAYTVITAAATSADSSYNGLNASDVSVTNVDNDTYNTIFVDTVADTLDGNTSSIASLIANKGADGRISLREAIIAANNTVNGAGGPDQINFNISGTGIHTINLASLLPTISGAVYINASSDDSYATNGNRPAIVLNGGGTIQDGLRLWTGSDGSTIRGLVLQNFTQDAIDIAGSHGNTIAGNWIGLDSAGTGAAGNQQGINLWNSNNNLIGGSTAADRNVISANSGPGISINTDNGSSTGNLIRGNYIGTDSTGMAALGNASQGVYINAANNVIGGTTAGYGNVISGTVNWSGIALNTNASGTLIAGNLIGLNATGTAALVNNGGGITVLSANNTIGGVTAAARNVISGNVGRGLYITGAAATGNVVIGNYIGTNAAGTGDVNGTAQVNGYSGVVIDGGASGNRIGTNADGVNDAAERNVISGNNWFGVEMIGANTTGNLVQGNYIGTDATGLAALGNSNGGVSFWGGSGNTLGSGLSGAGNVISGNGTGVMVANAASNNKVQGNLIGLGADGSTLIGNTGVGVHFYNGGSSSPVTGNVIGTDGNGTNDAAERNVISGNYRGIALENAEVSGNRIAGNLIGTDVTGTLARGNISDGVFIFSGASGNTVGGTQDVQANTLAFNGRDGIRVEDATSTGNVFLRNSIHGNTALGINLVGGSENAFGVTANDAGDADTGPNTLLNTVTLQQAVTNGSTLYLSGSFTGAPNTYYRIEVFSSPSADPSGFGEGRTYIGSVNMPVDASGTVSGTYSFAGSVAAGAYISATLTRTDATYTSYYETSEYSNAIAAAAPNTAPAGANGTVTAVEDTVYTFTPTDFGFSDADGHSLLRVWFDTLPASGTLKWNATALAAGSFVSASDIAAGLLTYTPATNVNGTAVASFTFRVQDNGGTLGGGLDTDPTPNTITINLTPVNDAPVANADAISGNEDTAIPGNVLANDTDIDGNPLTATLVAGPANGSLTLNADGSFSYTPNANWNGTDSFQYLVNDGSGPAHYWGLEGSGADALGGANGTLMNGPTTIAGKTGNALQFDGVDDHIALPDLVYNNAFSLAFYFRVADNSGNSLQYFYSHGPSPTTALPNTIQVALVENAYAVAGQRNSIVTTVWDSNDGGAGQIFTDVASLIGDGQWHQYTLTVTAGVGTQVYVDGVLRGSLATGGDAIDPTGNAYIGARADLNSSRFLNAGGAMDSVALYNRALSASEVASLNANSQQATVTLTVNPVNDAPAGIDKTITTVEDTAYTFTVADFGFSDSSDTPANSLLAVRIATLPAAGSLTLNGVAVTAGQSVSASDINAGLLRFAPAADANGAGYASFSFQVQDNGGTANGGIDLDPTPNTITINVTPVNDAPVLTGAAVFSTISEDDVTNTGDLVSVFANNSSDADSGAVKGLAITAVDNTDGTWQYTLDGTNWFNIGNVSASSARLLPSDATARIRFVPNADWNGVTGMMLYKAWDQTSGTAGGLADVTVSGGTTAFSAQTNGAAMVVQAVNDAPVNTVPGAQSTQEDTVLSFSSANGNLISVGDIDAGNNPVQVTLTATNGIISLYSIAGLSFSVGDGIMDGTMTFSGTVAALNTALNGLSFTPNANFHGAASLQITTSDQGNSGSGGAKSDTDTVSITVNPVADTPSVTHTSTSEDTQTSSGLVISRDVSDGAEVTHFKITGISNGTLYLNDGVTQIANGSFITFAEGNAGLKFTPTANFNGIGSFTVQASTSGSDAGLGGGTAIANITVNAVNDAPVLDNTGTMTLTTITEDNTANLGNTVAEIIASAGGDRITDIDAGAVEGIAITGLSSGNGTWQYSTNGGGSWTAIGLVADNNALLLRDTDRLRFVPDGLNADFATVTFRAWDQSSGVAGSRVDASMNGGTTAFSTATGTASITVTAVNDAPVVANPVPDQLSTENVAFSFTVPAGTFVDVDAGDTLSYSAAGMPAWLSFDAATRTFSGTPGTADVGSVTLTVRATDSSGAWVEDSFVLTVGNVNDAPAGADRTVTTNEDTDYTFTVADFGFYDPSDMPANSLLAVKIATLPTVGSLTLNGVAVTAGQTISASDINAGLLRFAPATDANGAGYASFTFQVQDNGGTANGGVDLDPTPNTITINVTPVNDAPAATSINLGSLAEDGSRLITQADLLAGASDVDGDTLTAINLFLATGSGVLTNNGNGTWTFVPDADWNGPVSFAFEVSDGTTSVPNTAALSVTPVNDAPAVASPIANQNATEDALFSFTFDAGTFADVDTGDTLSYSAAGMPAWLNFDADTRTFSGTPANADVGSHTVTVRATDASGAWVEDSFDIVVANSNDAPVVAPIDLGSLDEDNSLIITQAMLLAGATDDDGDALTAVNLTVVSGNGTLTDNGDGTWTFTPAADWNGAASFGFDVSDGVASTPNTAHLAVNPVNDAPVAAGDSVSGNEDSLISGNVLANDSDIDSGSLTAVLVAGPAHGTLAFNADGSFGYTPDADWNGSDSFQYQINDGALDSNVATVSITVNPVNDAPVASDASFTVNEDTVHAGTLPAASDIDSALVTYALGTAAAHGSVTVGSDGSFSYTPASNYSGADSFSFTVNDGAGGSNTYTVTITVNAVNDAPAGAPVGLGAINEDTSLIITQAALLAGANDIDGDALTAVNLTLISGSGTLIDNSNGTWTFTPAADWNGVASFGFDVSDGTAATPNTANLTVNPVNDAPTVTPIDLGNINEDGSLLITQAALLVGANDIDGDALTAVNLTLTSGNGTLTDNGNGTWTFTPAADWNGAASFAFDVSDGASSTPNMASLAVNPVNDAPVIATNTLSIDEGGTVVLGSANLYAADLEQGAADLTYTVSNVTHGQFEWAAVPGMAITSFTQADIDAGLVMFVHDASDFAPSYDVSVSDGVAGAGPNPATVNFTPVDEGIKVTALSGTDTTEAGGTVTFDVSLNSRPLSDVTVFIASGNPAEGTASVSSLTFTAANWNVAQQVTVTGMNDFIDDGDQAYVVQLHAASSDRNYDLLAAPDVALTNRDDDTAGVRVTPLGGLVTDEAGASDSFSVVLSSQPLADVSFQLTSSNPGEGVLSTASLTFTAADWNMPRIVTVVGVADTLADGTVAYQIVVAPALSADPLYDGIGATVIDAVNLDVANPASPVPPPAASPDGGAVPPAPPLPATPDPTPSPAGAATATNAVGTPAIRAPEPATDASEPAVATPDTRLTQRARPPVSEQPVQRDVLTAPDLNSNVMLRLFEYLQASFDLTGADGNAIAPAVQVDISQDQDFRVEMLSQGTRITAVTLSVGAVWWALRAGGLFASLLTSLPAWRSFDVLPVLDREPDDADDPWGLGEPAATARQADRLAETVAP